MSSAPNLDALKVAWLERPDGTTVALKRDGDTTIGRGPNNVLVLADGQVSRSHAMIRPMGKRGFVVMDLGSTNGTFLNSNKLHRPTLLANHDRLEIGSSLFHFRQNDFSARAEEVPSLSTETICRVVQQTCYLLVIDIVGFTKLTQTISTERLASDLERWTLRSSSVIRARGGIVNQYLGDAVFAYWKDQPGVGPEVLAAVGELWGQRADFSFPYRLVLHHGEVRLGGVAVSGVENVLGAQVNYLFRMEKLCSQLRRMVFLSGAAAQALGVQEQAQSVGRHAVKDFPEELPFFDAEGLLPGNRPTPPASG